MLDNLIDEVVDDDHRETLMFIENELIDNDIIDDMLLVIVLEVEDEVLVDADELRYLLDIDDLVECENLAELVEQLVIMLDDDEVLGLLVPELDEVVYDELEQLEVLLDVQLHITDDEVDEEDELADELDVSEYSSLDIKQLADIIFLDELVILVEIIQYIALLQMVL